MFFLENVVLYTLEEAHLIGNWNFLFPFQKSKVIRGQDAPTLRDCQ